MIHLRYENFALSACHRPILAPVTMDLEGPSVTALLGPSGVGKSSLLRATQHLILRAKDDWRHQGDITLNGRSVFTIKNLARRIGFIHQRPRMLNGSVLDNVTFALKYSAGLGRKERRRKAEHVLGQVGLWEEIGDLNLPAWCLSGGQAQRLAVARAIALEPEVLLMDEPCSALDPIKSKQMEDLIREVARERLVVMVTHDPIFTQRVANQVAFLMPAEQGARLLASGETSQIFSSPPKPAICEFIRFGGQGHCPLIAGREEAICAICAPAGSFGRLLLFICDGNTSRSPIAEAICNQFQQGVAFPEVAAISAGISTTGGKPMAAAARQALSRRGVTPHAHKARPITTALADKAAAIYCMTNQQQKELVKRFPSASDKIDRLDPNCDIVNPAGGEQVLYDQVVRCIEAAVGNRLGEWMTP